MTKKIFITLTLITGIIFLSWYWSLPKVQLVETVTVQPGLTEATVSNTRAGTITACQRSKLALSIGGQIAEILVSEGQIVDQGTRLLELWNEDLKAQVQASNAGLDAATYEKKGLCIQAAADNREASRQRNLFSQKLVSEEIIDIATTKAKASSAACTAAEARWKKAKAILSLAQASLKKTYLVAPFKGTIAEVTGEVGEFSTPSPPGVATPPAIDLLTADCHYIKAPIDEVDAGRIEVAMPVRVSLDAFRGLSYQGEVRRISPYVQDYSKQARTVEIEVELLTQKLPVLLAGYSVDVEVILAKTHNGLRIPSDAILNDTSVFVINRDNRVEERDIVTGLSNWQFTEVVSGLEAGEKVLLSVSGETVSPGTKVRTQ